MKFERCDDCITWDSSPLIRRSPAGRVIHGQVVQSSGLFEPLGVMHNSARVERVRFVAFQQIHLLAPVCKPQGPSRRRGRTFIHVRKRTDMQNESESQPKPGKRHQKGWQGSSAGSRTRKSQPRSSKARTKRDITQGISPRHEDRYVTAPALVTAEPMPESWVQALQARVPQQNQPRKVGHIEPWPVEEVAPDATPEQQSPTAV